MIQLIAAGTTWFFICGIVTLLTLSVAAAILADARGRSGFGYFAMAFLLGLFGLLPGFIVLMLAGYMPARDVIAFNRSAPATFAGRTEPAFA